VAGALGLSMADVVPQPAAFSAPLFRGLVERMQDDVRRVVLDLGPARPETVALFSQFRCRLEITDLADDLDWLNAIKDPGELRAACATLLPPRRHEATDLVLCWDLLNYLERPALTALTRELLPRLSPGALVHALIFYSLPGMPARPGRVVPADGQRLLHAPTSAAQKPAPRYAPDELTRLMPGYAVERAMLLRNGMQEFLFSR
jgi:hypothetical protein